MTGPAAWTLPAPLDLGRLGVLELRPGDPAQPPLPRPSEDRLGPLAVRRVEPLADGRGWRLTVQPLAPGSFRIPPLDLGDGRATTELRVTVPRTVPYGAPWMGVGGGNLDRLPALPFPWPWTLPLLLPLAALGWVLAWHHRRGAGRRRRRAARRTFLRHWPPGAGDRAALDAAHAAGRDLLAAHFGPQALSWDAHACRARGLASWGDWIRALDEARFGAGPAPAGPAPAALLAALERP